MKRFLWMLRFALCALTSFPVLKLSYPDLHIWWPKEYTDDNFSILFHSSYFTWGIVYAFISLLLFYWIMPMILQRLLTRTIEVKIQTAYNAMAPHHIRWLERFLRRLLSFAFRWMFLLRIHRPTHTLPSTEQAPSYNEFSIILIRFFVLCLHMIFVVIFAFHQYGLSTIIAILLVIGIMSFITWCIPVYLYIRAALTRIVIEQNNQYVQ